MAPTTTLYRPLDGNELRLIASSGYREFPPRLPGQPIFYPVLNEEYAIQIARDWNAKNSGSGVEIVTKFLVKRHISRSLRFTPSALAFIKNTGFQPLSW